MKTTPSFLTHFHLNLIGWYEWGSAMDVGRGRVKVVSFYWLSASSWHVAVVKAKSCSTYCSYHWYSKTYLRYLSYTSSATSWFASFPPARSSLKKWISPALSDIVPWLSRFLVKDNSASWQRIFFIHCVDICDGFDEDEGNYCWIERAGGLRVSDLLY